MQDCSPPHESSCGRWRTDCTKPIGSTEHSICSSFHLFHRIRTDVPYTLACHDVPTRPFDFNSWFVLGTSRQTKAYRTLTYLYANRFRKNISPMSPRLMPAIMPHSLNPNVLCHAWGSGSLACDEL